jgi:threonine dehydrogenase-like Zn-dependent dehydrogenase
MKPLPSLARSAAAMALLLPGGFCFQLPSQYQRCHRHHRSPLHHSDDCTAVLIIPSTAIFAASAQDISGKTFDLAVIGAGPVGVSAALQAARHPYQKKVLLIDAPRASGMLMDERSGEDLSLGGPTGLFSKALRDTGKRISVSSLKGMGLRDDR